MSPLPPMSYLTPPPGRYDHPLMLDESILLPLVSRALSEDLPDITSDSIFAPEDRAEARVIVKQPGVIAGLQVIELTVRQLDPGASVNLMISDGDRVRAGEVIARTSGTVRALLGAERTLLNILQRASGVATLTRRYVDAVEGTGVKILDTRKTTPGLRLLEKAAVVAGGGVNHRLGLHDMFLIKDNHVDRAGGIVEAIARARAAEMDRPLMIEVRTLDELDQALDREPDFILLDNMSTETMSEAVRRRNRRSGNVLLEASGGVTLDTVRHVALTGVDRISVGALTHSAPSLDISMKLSESLSL